MKRPDLDSPALRDARVLAYLQQEGQHSGCNYLAHFTGMETLDAATSLRRLWRAGKIGRIIRKSKSGIPFSTWHKDPNVPGGVKCP